MEPPTATPVQHSGAAARWFSAALALLALASLPLGAQAQRDDGHGYAIGVQLRFGGRYDNVRMCVATDAGVPGGPAGDIALFSTFELSPTWEVTATLPVFRPILFAAKFDMLQFEPQVAFQRRFARDGADFLLGPSVGVSLHYGPGYESEASGAGRDPSFWAVGPMFGGYAGFDFDRDGKLFNFQLGLSPYVAPLISPERGKSGVVFGGMLDALLRFSP